MVVDPESYREDRMKLMLKRIMGFFEKAYNRKMTEGDWPVVTRLFGALSDEISREEGG
jgi:hypothetical protein